MKSWGSDAKSEGQMQSPKALLERCASSVGSDCRLETMSAVTCRAGVIRARGSGWVGLRVWMDVASASGSLRQLIFHVQVLVAVEGSSRGAMARGAEGQEGYECRVDNISRQLYLITKLIYFCVLRGLLYNAVDYRAGKKTARCQEWILKLFKVEIDQVRSGFECE